jgi:hypothetical protein
MGQPIWLFLFGSPVKESTAGPTYCNNDAQRFHRNKKSRSSSMIPFRIGAERSDGYRENAGSDRDRQCGLHGVRYVRRGAQSEPGCFLRGLLCVRQSDHHDRRRPYCMQSYPQPEKSSSPLAEATRSTDFEIT